MSSRMRVTKGHSGNRRSHHKLKSIRLSVCSNCGANHERHKLCLGCGFYRGKSVLEIKTKKALVTNIDKENLVKKQEVKELNEKDNLKTNQGFFKKKIKKVQNKG